MSSTLEASAGQALPARRPPLTIEAVLAEAPGWLEPFAASIRSLDYENKGVMFSEMFFIELGARLAGAKRLIESGRARGQSTLILARRFPELPIISFEFVEGSADAAVAQARLAPYANADLRFGDATQALPAIVREGDVVFIDGPKGFRAVRLALTLLRHTATPAVFLHDMCVGTLERRFLDRHVPGVFYSDDPRFARLAHGLDAGCIEAIPPERRFEAIYPDAGYGFSMACLPRIPDAPYGWLQLRVALAGMSRLVDRGRANDD